MTAHVAAAATPSIQSVEAADYRPPGAADPAAARPVAVPIPVLTYTDLAEEVRLRRLEELRGRHGPSEASDAGSTADAQTGEPTVGSPADAQTAEPATGSPSATRKQAIAAETKALNNTLAALQAFQEANLLGPDAILGPEIVNEVAFERACLAMSIADRAPATTRRHRSEMTSRIRPWALGLRRRTLLASSHFPTVFGALMIEAGTDITAIAAQTDTPYMTLRSWTVGGKTPAMAESLAAVRRIERALDLEPGTLERLCKVNRVEFDRARLKIKIGQAELRRVRRFLPADFQDRSADEQREIYEWVWDNMLLSPENEVIGRSPRTRYLVNLYGRAEAEAAAKSAARSRRASKVNDSTGLQAEIDALVRFKTADFPEIDMRRDTHWKPGKSTRSAIRRLEMFFGALKASAPLEPLSLADVLTRENIQTFIAFMRARRGAYTASITSALEVIGGLLNDEYGFVRQSRALFSAHPAAVSERAWKKACATALSFVWQRHAEVTAQITVGRDPFLPIEVVLAAERPREAYAAIAREIRDRLPAAVRSLERARVYRFLAAFLYAFQLPLRVKNLAECGIRPKGSEKTPMPVLSHRERAELWNDPATGVWYHRQPRSAFKNYESPATMDVEIPLDDVDGLYEVLEEYLALRPLLLNGRADPGTLFVNDMTRGKSHHPEMTPEQFSYLWRTLLQKFGIFNPYTGTGAIRGLRLHGPHSIRHVIATDAVKVTGGFSEAAALLFATWVMAAKHYARFVPQDQFLRASKILRIKAPAPQLPKKTAER